MNKKKGLIRKSIKIQELDEKKIEPTQKILDMLNKEKTLIAIKGANGSGKTTSFNEAYNQFKVNKTIINSIAKFFLYFSLFIWTIVYSKTKINNINRRISIRNEIKININLWSIFGIRSSDDYSSKSVTASFGDGTNNQHRSLYKE